MPDKKDILVRLALCEQSFNDISKRLEKIEASLESLNRISNMGRGVWKAIFFIGGVLSAVLAFLKISKHDGV